MQVEILDNPSGESSGGRGRTCAITQVSLPLSIVPDDGPDDHDRAVVVVRNRDIKKTIDWLQRRLLEDYHTYAPFFFHANKLWVRFSGMIYVEAGDYEKGIRGIVELVKAVRSGQVEGLGAEAKL